MHQRTVHSAPSDAPRRLPLWRWAALFAVFFGLLAQLLHTHAATAEDGFSSKGAHALLASQSSDLCPLCVAAHTSSASPSVEAVALLGAAVVESPCSTETFHAVQPAFAHCSRPPPAFLL